MIKKKEKKGERNRKNLSRTRIGERSEKRIRKKNKGKVYRVGLVQGGSEIGWLRDRV